MSQISFSSAGDKEAVPGLELHIKKNLTVVSPINLPRQVDIFLCVPGILLHFTASVHNSEWHERIL